MHSGNLPANFASTANGLEALAFHAKDALLVVDDFVPAGGLGERVLNGLAERLFRGAGNRQGRNRLGGDGRLHSPKPPRGLLLATGEELPTGQSIRARLLIVSVRRGDVDVARLAECQRAGRGGQLAAAMGAFITWVAAGYEDVQQRLLGRVLELRSQRMGQGGHARLPTALSELQAAWEVFLSFALDVGAIGRVEHAELTDRGNNAFSELERHQACHHHAGDPGLQFVALLRAALADGHTHVADRRGRAPESAELWGWRRKGGGGAWLPRGVRIGWVSKNDLYLDPALSFDLARRMAGTDFQVGQGALGRRMRERGLLASTDVARGMLPVRRTLEGSPRQVFHLRSGDWVD